MSIPEEKFEKYLFFEILASMEKAEFEMMEKFRNWQTDEDLDRYIYHRGRYEATRDIIAKFLRG